LNSGALSYNYAFPGMTGGGSHRTQSGTDGVNMTLAQLYTPGFWTTNSNWNSYGWDDEIWTFSTDKLPILNDVGGGQTGDPPAHLIPYIVTYDVNGGGGTAVEDIKYSGEAFTASDNTFTAPSGKTFMGWNTAANGTGTSYAAGAKVTMPGAALTLYAIWDEIPTVTNVTPSGTGAALSGSIEITFSEAMDTTAGTVSLDGGSTALTDGSWTNGNSIYTLSYTVQAYSTQYTVSIYGFADPAGNEMDSDETHSFTTMAEPDTIKPTVTGVTPSGTDAALSGSIEITFSETMDTTAGTVSLDGGNTALTGGSWSNGNSVYTLSYTVQAYSTEYTMSIYGFADPSGNVMTDDATHKFTTQSQPGDSTVEDSDFATRNVSRNSIRQTVSAANGTASVTVSASDMSTAIKNVKEENSGTLVIAPKITGTAKKVSVELPKTSLSTIAAETNADLEVDTPVGKVTIPNAALASIAAQASGSAVTVSLDTVEATSLTVEQQTAAGDNPVYDISIMSGSDYIASFGGGSVTISLPYTLKDGETGENVTVWYLDDAGDLVEMACTYDAQTGLASFATTHLSYYVVGYAAWTNPFADVASDDWYYDAVCYAAGQGLFAGITGTSFEPDTAMTRAMLVTVLYRLEGEPAVAGTNAFTDVEDGSWYTDAVIWASGNAIVSGYGGGLFGTNDAVTREQMAAVLYRYAVY
jgi:uncharacterized repeat protein (TIGR02543 family)